MRVDAGAGRGAGRGVLAGLGAGIVALVVTSSAWAGTTVVPVTSFGVTVSQCAGGVQSQTVQQLQWMVNPLLGPKPTLQLPTVSLNPNCTEAPSLLSSIASASNTVSSSPDGSATVSSQAVGNAVLTEAATAEVDFSATVPLSQPASSVDVTIPYTTTGVTWSGDRANGLVIAAESAAPSRCADGSSATESPFYEQGSLIIAGYHAPTPAGSGTVTGIRFSCRSGSTLVGDVRFRVIVATAVYAATGQAESATANIAMHDVTATITS